MESFHMLLQFLPLRQTSNHINTTSHIAQVIAASGLRDAYAGCRCLVRLRWWHDEYVVGLEFGTAARQYRRQIKITMWQLSAVAAEQM